MKIDFIIAYVQRYEFGHERDFVPPITGIKSWFNSTLPKSR